MLDSSVFKAYDVRGLYGSQLDEAGARAIGRAYVEQFAPRRIAVGRDMRLSSPTMAAALIEGATEAGADVLDIGLVGTEMVYFAVGSLGLDGGVMVTASHNPKEYTGMKIVRAGALPVGGDSGLLDVRDRALVGTDPERSVPGGNVTKLDIWPGYVGRVLSFIDPAALRPLKVVIDAANGMAGAMLPPVLERLPVEVVRCYFEPDGSFPNHEPNPLLPENREFIVRKTLEEGADLGVAFDGDADRCFFVDDARRVRPGRLRHGPLRRGCPGEGAGCEGHLRPARQLGGSGGGRGGRRRRARQPRRTRLHQGADARGRRRIRRRGLGPLLLPRVLPGRHRRRPVPRDAGADLEGRHEALRVAPRRCRERYFITGEINTPVADVPAKLAELEERYGAEGTVSHLDGLSVEAQDWHFNVRPSNTEPLLRLNLEARSEELMERKRDEVLGVIRS